MSNNTLRTFFILTISLLLLTQANRHIAPAQEKKPAEDQDAVRLDATLVQVPAVILDRKGKFVTDLTREEFALFDEGKRQEISLFTAIKQNFNAVLVLDTSNSAEDRLKVIQNTALSFARQVTANDPMMVVSFDNEIRQLTDFTTDQAEIEQAIKSTESGFGKLLHEAIARGLEQLRDKEGRRALIIFSDGIDLGSVGVTADSNIRLAEEIGAVIYAVKFDTRWFIEAEARRNKAESKQSTLPFEIDGRIPLPPDFGGTDPDAKKEKTGPRIEIGPPPPPLITVTDAVTGRTESNRKVVVDPITTHLDKMYGEADNYLNTLTQRTGGAVFSAANLDNTLAAFALIADELRNQYMIGFYPSSERRDGKFRKIKLEVKRKDIQVRARQGYRLLNVNREP